MGIDGHKLSIRKVDCKSVFSTPIPARHTKKSLPECSDSYMGLACAKAVNSQKSSRLRKLINQAQILPSNNSLSALHVTISVVIPDFRRIQLARDDVRCAIPIHISQRKGIFPRVIQSLIGHLEDTLPIIDP